MTTIWMAGGENPAHHAHFVDAGVDRVAVNVASLLRNYGDAFTGLDIGKLDDGPEWLAWSDSMASLDDLLDVIDRIGSMPTYVVGPEEWSSHENYLPTWNGESKMPVIRSGGLVVTDRAFKSPELLKQALAARRHDRVIGAITGRPKGLERLSLAVVTNWWNVTQFGETHIWTGNELRRFRQTEKERVRFEHADDIAALNLDPGLVADDDPDAVIALALRSWMALAAAIEDRGAAVLRLVTDDDLAVLEQVPEVTTGGSIESQNGGTPGTALARLTPRARQRVPLPVMVVEPVEDADGQPTEHHTVAPANATLRRCDNCFLANACDAYQPAHECAYELPVVIRTKTQLRSLLATIVEMQGQRVLMASFIEQLQGGDLSPVTGSEMDRLMRLIKDMRDIEHGGSGFRLSIEGSGDPSAAQAGGGILSALFGAKVGSAAGALEKPIPTGSDDIVDANLVDSTTGPNRDA